MFWAFLLCNLLVLRFRLQNVNKLEAINNYTINKVARDTQIILQKVLNVKVEHVKSISLLKSAGKCNYYGILSVCS